MKYCSTCGHPLIVKELEHEGMIPFCEHCKEYRFPIFNTAVSMVVLNPQKDKILLILKDNYYNINVSVQTWDSECTDRDA